MVDNTRVRQSLSSTDGSAQIFHKFRKINPHQFLRNNNEANIIFVIITDYTENAPIQDVLRQKLIHISKQIRFGWAGVCQKHVVVVLYFYIFG